MRLFNRAKSLLFVSFLTILFSMPAHAGIPSCSMAFVPSTIGPGSVSTLTFTLTNDDTVSTNIAFTDTLPADLTIADPAMATISCHPNVGSVLTATPGSNIIALADLDMAAGASCTITVDVTATIPAAYTNNSFDITSDGGSVQVAPATLTVSGTLPGFTKIFNPDTVNLGQTSTLTFTISNGGGAVAILTCTDNLPAGMKIADPANVAVNGFSSPPALTALPGSSIISFSGGVLSAETAGTISVDVVATGVGNLGNSSSDLTIIGGSCGKANDTLMVNIQQVDFYKSFTNDPAAPGGTAVLSFTLTNRSRSETVTNIQFTDDLDATLSGLSAVGLPESNVCGAGSLLSGTGTISLTGGTLAPEQSVTFTVTVNIPAGAAPGSYPNTTSSLTYDISGDGSSSNPATDTLQIAYMPTFTKTFLENPAGGGDVVTLEYTITNTHPTQAATNIGFTDNVTQFMSGITVNLLPASGFCGAGSTMVQSFNPIILTMSGGSLPAGGSSTFQVTLVIPSGISANTYVNTTSPLTATIDGVNLVGPAATDSLLVVTGPRLTKTFTDDPVEAGGTVTLEFTLTNPNDTQALTNISFTDDLDAVLTNLVATGLPVTDVCGSGSILNGTGSISLTGGSLAAGASETFSVTLQVPAGALPGDYLNTTSNVTADAGGVSKTGSGASDTLTIAGLRLTKAFIDDPVLPGGNPTLRFTIENISTIAMDTIRFTDNLNTTLSGLTATNLPLNDICGAGSSLTGAAGDTFLFFNGGLLAAGTSCSFDVELLVPPGAAAGQYENTTSILEANSGGSSFVFKSASDTLEVASQLLSISKSFTDDPVNPGATVTLEFTLTNLSATKTLTDISFVDDLDASLTGLVATGLPISNVCGAGSTLSGTDTIALANGSLAPGASATFSVILQVPAVISFGAPIINTTGPVEYSVEGTPFTGGTASDTLRVNQLSISKSFSSPNVAGGTSALTFTLENLDTVYPVTGISFTDDLNAVIPGMAAIGLPKINLCGAGQIAGTSLLSFSGGSLDPGQSCSFDVTVQIPSNTTPGSYINEITNVFSNGLAVSGSASAPLVVDPVPGFSKAFSPATIPVNGISTLTFAIDNSGSATNATALAFADTLPAGVVVASTPNAGTTCVGGSVTAVPATNSISYAGGEVSAGGTCTITVDVTSAAPGSYLNTSGSLTSSHGSSGTASDTLTVEPLPGFSKVFSPDSVPVNVVTTLTFTIDNTGSTLDADNLAFTDSFPAGLEVASPSNATTSCGGTVTAIPGSGGITYSGGSIAGGGTGTISVDVISAVQGSYLNVTGALTSTLGNSGTASDILGVAQPPAPGFSKVFSPDMIDVNDITTLTFTIDNTSSAFDANGLLFTDNLPAGVMIAATPTITNTCNGGTLTAVANTGVISFSGGSVPANSSCTISVDVTATAPGTHVNTTSDLISSFGNSGTATDSLTVASPPAPGFSCSFSPDGIAPNDVSTLTFTIDNSAGPLAVNALSFNNYFPAGLQIASIPNASVTCLGGTLTADAGAGFISYTGGSVAAGSTCTISVDVTSATPGSYENISGHLTSSLGDSGSASDTLLVSDEIPTVSEWGMIFLALLLGFFAIRHIRKNSSGEAAA